MDIQMGRIEDIANDLAEHYFWKPLHRFDAIVEAWIPERRIRTGIDIFIWFVFMCSSILLYRGELRQIDSSIDQHERVYLQHRYQTIEKLIHTCSTMNLDDGIAAYVETSERILQEADP